MKTDKPTHITYPDGNKEWWLNNKLHRKNGPAIETTNGNRYWYSNGKLHREDGPAIEDADDAKEWWLNGEEYSEPDFYRELYKLGKITKEELFIKLI